MAIVDPIEIHGLIEFTRALRTMDKDLPRAVREANNEAAQIVVIYVQAHMPRKTGRAHRTVRATSTRTAARVTEGGARAPYVPWLDFGGRVGRARSVRRPFLKAGRYLYPALSERRSEIEAALHDALHRVAVSAGVSTDG